METAREYVADITDTVKSFWHGMSVTLSYMFRKPITIQYQGPGKPIRGTKDLRVVDLIPPRYRGFLEVDMAICTGCQACERACPIGCINIDIVKDPADPKKKYMERFDIDIGKCMFCGLCVEPCPTGAIQHSREFESAVMHFNNLTFRFIPQGTLVPFFKPPKNAEAIPRRPTGEIIESLRPAWDKPPPPFPAKETAKPAPKPAAKAGAGTALGYSLAKRALEVRSDVAKLQKVYEEAMANTDCGDCGYADCFGYSDALAKGTDTDPTKCAPGGAESAANIKLIQLALKTGKAPEPEEPAAEAAPAPAAAPAEAAPAVPAGPPLAQTLSKEELFKVVREAMADTDCGDCEYPDCDGYSRAIVYEGQTDLTRCAPGGEETKQKLYQIFGRKP